MDKTIGIIGGEGKMGKYFADFFKRNGYEVIISDKNTKLTNSQLAKKADVVIVSVPIGITEKIIKEVAHYTKKDGLLLDFTSLKVFPMEAMEKTKGSYLGCHPLFAPTVSIEGQMIILCKGRGDKWYEWYKNLLLKNKVSVRELTAKKHDKLMAYIQSLTHFSYLALADALRKSGLSVKDLLEYQSPVYRMRLNVMGRILNHDPNLYAQIQLFNPDSLRVMRELVSISNEWIDIVEKKDLKTFESRFNKSSKYFGNFKKLAMEESDFLIEQINLRKLADSDQKKINKPDKTYDIATLGPEDTFSSLAAKKYDPKAKIWYTNSISDVFDIVKKGIIKKGIVPIDNLLTGTVAETADDLFESNLKIQKEFHLPIHHCLVTLDKIDSKKINVIYSHPQPIKQCKNYLRKHFPKASTVKMPSSTAGLKKLISDNCYNGAAICSMEAAKKFQMNIVDEKIEDYKANTTRFFVIGKSGICHNGKNCDNREFATMAKTATIGNRNKTSIAFYFSADAPGTLYQVLGEFAKTKVNMTKIESSANPQIPGGNVFYIDFEGSTDDLNIKKMLTRIKKLVEKIKILGCY